MIVGRARERSSDATPVVLRLPAVRRDGRSTRLRFSTHGSPYECLAFLALATVTMIVVVGWWRRYDVAALDEHPNQPAEFEALYEMGRWSNQETDPGVHGELARAMDRSRREDRLTERDSPIGNRPLPAVLRPHSDATAAHSRIRSVVPAEPGEAQRTAQHSTHQVR